MIELHTGDHLYLGKRLAHVEVQPDLYDPQGGVAHLTLVPSGRRRSMPLRKAEALLSATPPTKRPRKRKGAAC